MTRKIFGICGAKGAGKDTAGAAIMKWLGGCAQINFADPLREVCHVALGLSYEEMLDPALKEEVLERWPSKSPRQVMQHVGTELFRNSYPGVWVRAWRRGVDATALHVVCTDYRFTDEAEALQGADAVLLKVVRPGLAASDGHVSEQGWRDLPADIQLVNRFGTAESFSDYVVQMLIKCGALPPVKSSDAIVVGERVRHLDGEYGRVVSLTAGMTDVPGAVVRFDKVDVPVWFPLSELVPVAGPRLVNSSGIAVNR